jgi:predicted DNA-binding transcriptional regulator YafY
MSKGRRLRQVHTRRSISVERTARLYRLLRLLGKGPQTRTALMRGLGLDIRGFYRDLELLRQAGVVIGIEWKRYLIQGTLESALAALPFPDPRLTLGEARRLAVGQTPAHRKVRELLEAIVNPRPVRAKKKA